jgi:hypothetical protein
VVFCARVISSNSAQCQCIDVIYSKPLNQGLAHMSAKLVDRVAILVAVRRFRGMGAADSRSLRSDNYVRMQHFVDNFEVSKPRACIMAESGG